MNPFRQLFFVIMVILVMCTVAGIIMSTCDSTFIRRWDPCTIDAPNNEHLEARLTTVRTHKVRDHSNDLEYTVTIEPVNPPFSESALRMLSQKTKQKAEMRFSCADDEMAPRMTITCELAPVLKEGVIVRYEARKRLPYPPELRKANAWFLELTDAPPPPVPIIPGKFVPTGQKMPYGATSPNRTTP